MTKNKIENELFVDTSSLAIRRLYISRTPNVSFNTTYSKNSNRTSINAEQHSNLICVTLLSRSCKSTQKKHSASDSQVDVQCQRRRRQRGTHTVPEKQQITRGILGLRTYEPFLRSDALLPTSRMRSEVQSAQDYMRDPRKHYFSPYMDNGG